MLLQYQLSMGRPINHYQVKTDINLTEKINAAELIKAGIEGRLSTHKIWIPPNAEYPIHEHPSPHIIHILEGGGYMRYWQNGAESKYDITTGDIFHIPENVPHQVGADSRGTVMLAVSVDSKALDDPERMRIL